MTSHPKVAPEIAEIETAASKAQLDMPTVLRAAGVNASTWWRWKNGKSDPRLGLVRRVGTAVAELTAERAA